MPINKKIKKQNNIETLKLSKILLIALKKIIKKINWRINSKVMIEKIPNNLKNNACKKIPYIGNGINLFSL